MAEEGAVEEQQQGSEEQEQGSEDQSQASAGSKAASTSESDSGETEGGRHEDEAQAQGGSDDSAETDDEGQGDSDETVGDYRIDDVDPSRRADEEDEARAQIKKLEKDGPPEDLGDWPTGKAMYLTFGGAEGDATYEEGETSQLGPSSTRHFADGSVEVQGEMADDPSQYKAEKSVFDEADELGMDKSGKHDAGDDAEDDEASSDESSEGSAQAEGSDDESSQSDDSASSASEGDGSQARGPEGETADRS